MWSNRPYPRRGRGRGQLRGDLSWTRRGVGGDRSWTRIRASTTDQVRRRITYDVIGRGMGRGTYRPTRGRRGIVRARPAPPGDDESSSEEDSGQAELHRHRAEWQNAMVRSIHDATEEAAVIQGCMSALECLLFEHPPPVSSADDYAVEQCTWAMSQPRFQRHLADIRVAFRDVVPEGDMFTQLIRNKLERVLRGAETLTVVTIQCNINVNHEDQEPPGPPPGPSALAGPLA